MAVRKNKSANIYLNKVIHSVLFSVHIKFNGLILVIKNRTQFIIS